MKNASHKKNDHKILIVFLLLVTAGVVARISFQHIPNFAPVAALALFAGYFFRNRLLAICVPLSVMFISDRLIDAGGYPWLLMLTVYGLLTLPVFSQGWLRKAARCESRSATRLAGSALVVGGFSLGSSLLFFFGTNGMVWATTSFYPPTAAGLAACYAAAIPFFQYTLAGDLVFSSILFGAFAAWKLAASSSANQLATTA